MLCARDFAFLEELVNGQPIAYLDSASSTQKPRQVLDAMREFYEHSYANVHRGVYLLAERATEGYEGARRKVAAFVNAPSEREVVFTRSATEAINLVAYAWGLDNLGPGDVVVVTELEHHANFVPWQYIASRTGASFRHIPIDDLGELQLDALDALRARGTSRSSRPASSRTRSGRSTRSSGSPSGRTSRARSWSSTPRRPRRTGRRRAGARLRLPRVLLAQALRPERCRRALGAARSCSRGCRRSTSAAR